MDDPDLEVALFLSEHPNYRPEDFGYRNGDYILIDLIRLHDRVSAEVRNSRK